MEKVCKKQGRQNFDFRRKGGEKEMRKEKLLKVVIILLLSIFSTSAVLAGWFSSDKAGTTGASFLKIGVGGRPIGMGETYGAVSDDVNAIYWNPAGLSQIKESQISVMHAMWLETIFYDFLAYAQPLKIGVIGGGASYLSMAEMDKLDVDSGGNLVETGETFRPYDLAVALSYGMPIGPLMVGASLKYIGQEIDDEKAMAFGVDIGTLWKKGKLALGFSVQNIGSQIKFIDESAPLPLNIRLGAAYNLPLPGIHSHLLLALDGNAPIDDDPNAHIGMEYAYKKIKDIQIAARVGLKSEAISDLDGFSGFSCGLGFIWGPVGVDYAWVPYGELGSTHRISLIVKFGKTGEVSSKRAETMPPKVEGMVVEEGERGLVIRLGSRMLFKEGESTLTPDAYPALEEVAKILKKYPKKSIIVEGYADNRGSKSFNLKLSRLRADSVANYLIKNCGIPSSQIAIKSYGEAKPIASNATSEGREKNRRVEIVILK